MDPQLDHVLTFANIRDVDDHAALYRALGFVVSEETRPYKPGLRNRFIQFGCEYLELVWVEDEDEFASGGREEFARMYADLPTLRRAARPFSIGFTSPDVQALHRRWTRRGYAVPPVWSIAPPGSPPILSFQGIPNDDLPGASCFAITYHGAKVGQARPVQRAANTTYAVEGLTCVSAAAEDSARRWQALLNPDGAVTAAGGVFTVSVPPHTVWWMPPRVFEERHGVEWRPAQHRHGHIAAIHLLAEDLRVVTAMCGQRIQHRARHTGQDERLIVDPTGEDGVTLVIREYPIGRWRSERERATGEPIVVS